MAEMSPIALAGGPLTALVRTEAIRLGTDFSGLETPSVALKRVGVPFSLEFACEKQECLRKMLCRLYHPKIVFEDITTRRLDSVPQVDLYVSGFSCQPYSSEGKGLGENDPDRGSHLDYVLKYVLAKGPRVAVLENVQGLLSKRFRRTFKKASVLQKYIYLCFVDMFVPSFHGFVSFSS